MEKVLKDALVMTAMLMPAVICAACVVSASRHPEWAPEMIVVAYLTGMYAGRPKGWMKLETESSNSKEEITK
jgi:hypothetical protein